MLELQNHEITKLKLSYNNNLEKVIMSQFKEL